jgi:hypothetical protein
MPSLVVAMLGIAALLAVVPLAWAAYDNGERPSEEERAAGEARPEAASLPEAA